MVFNWGKGKFVISQVTQLGRHETKYVELICGIYSSWCRCGLGQECFAALCDLRS